MTGREGGEIGSIRGREAQAGRAGKFPKFLIVTTTTGRQAGWAGLGRPIFNTINTTN